MTNNNVTPSVRFLSAEDIRVIFEDAGRILSEVGVQVEHARAVELLAGAGAAIGNDGRVRIGSDVIHRALDSISSGLDLYDREGSKAVTLGAGTTHFAPGSAAIRVHDYEDGCARSSMSKDCVRINTNGNNALVLITALPSGKSPL